MRLRLYTEEVIDAAHMLTDYKGKCAEVHGHCWLLKIWIEGDSDKLDDVGILFDFGNIKHIKEIFDHKMINIIPPFHVLNPTAENLSRWIYKELKDKYSWLDFTIRLYETAVGKETYCECGDFKI